jgi:RimJ/RimL family protein N-acetyltransferase
MVLQPFEREHAALVASWARSAQEVSLMSGQDEFPFPPDLVTNWYTYDDDTLSYLFFDDEKPVGYGELWLDDDEDEIELARIIVAPHLRGIGIGTAFVRALLVPALESGYADIFLRVHPDNDRAIRACLRVGFQPVDDSRATERNVPQPTDFAWLQYPT